MKSIQKLFPNQSAQTCKRASYIPIWLVLVFVVLPLFNAQAQDPTRFENEIRAFEQIDLATAPPADPVLFTGSSSVRVWPDLPGDFNEYPAMNRGFGGSHMSDLVYYFDRVVTVYDPAIVLVYEGDNDLAGGKSVGQVYDDYLEFMALVEAQLPHADVAFIATKPSPSRSQYLDVMRELNHRLKALADGDPDIWFVDVFTPMMNASDEPRPELFGGDMLHMNAAGYALWQPIVASVLSEWSTPAVQTLLFDFGASETTTQNGPAPEDPCNTWNNITPDMGGSDTGELLDLVDSDNMPTGFGLKMLSRFNGANQNGTIESELFAANAARDSLYGNTETWQDLANVTPSFKLTGLDPNLVYNVTFYASRNGVSDVRETAYTLTGQGSTTVTLDPANNLNNVAKASGALPDANGEMTISLEPTVKNNNGYHFIYLGAMVLEQIPEQAPIEFIEDPIDQTVFEYRPVTFSVDVNGTPPYFVQWFQHGQVIADANEFSYTIDPVTLDLDGEVFSASVSNLLYSEMSAEAVLRVEPDVNAPVLLLAETPDGLLLRLSFDERLNPDLALEVSHYVVKVGDTEIEATDVMLDSDDQTVILTMAKRLASAFSVTVSHVQDLAGNEIELGALVLGDTRPAGFNFDFGASSEEWTTSSASDTAGEFWNNVTPAIGASNTGVLRNLVTMGHVSTDVDLVMLSRFNGANQNGTLASSEFPQTATRDSLFGNTKAWSGSSQIFPSFKLTGLVPSQAYRMTFYASRLGVSDNRETGYTIVGSASYYLTLNPANNVNAVASVGGVKADASGEIVISIAPTDKNNNGYHFTYLGVLTLRPEGGR